MTAAFLLGADLHEPFGAWDHPCDSCSRNLDPDGLYFEVMPNGDDGDVVLCADCLPTPDTN